MAAHVKTCKDHLGLSVPSQNEVHPSSSVQSQLMTAELLADNNLDRLSPDDTVMISKTNFRFSILTGMLARGAGSASASWLFSSLLA